MNVDNDGWKKICFLRTLTDGELQQPDWYNKASKDVKGETWKKIPWEQRGNDCVCLFDRAKMFEFLTMFQYLNKINNNTQTTWKNARDFLKKLLKVSSKKKTEVTIRKRNLPFFEKKYQTRGFKDANNPFDFDINTLVDITTESKEEKEEGKEGKEGEEKERPKTRAEIKWAIEDMGFGENCMGVDCKIAGKTSFKGIDFADAMAFFCKVKKIKENPNLFYYQEIGLHKGGTITEIMFKKMAKKDFEEQMFEENHLEIITKCLFFMLLCHHIGTFLNGNSKGKTRTSKPRVEFQEEAKIASETKHSNFHRRKILLNLVVKDIVYNYMMKEGFDNEPDEDDKYNINIRKLIALHKNLTVPDLITEFSDKIEYLSDKNKKDDILAKKIANPGNIHAFYDLLDTPAFMPLSNEEEYKDLEKQYLVPTAEQIADKLRAAEKKSISEETEKEIGLRKNAIIKGGFWGNVQYYFRSPLWEKKYTKDGKESGGIKLVKLLNVGIGIKIGSGKSARPPQLTYSFDADQHKEIFKLNGSGRVVYKDGNVPDITELYPQNYMFIHFKPNQENTNENADSALGILSDITKKKTFKKVLAEVIIGRKIDTNINQIKTLDSFMKEINNSNNKIEKLSSVLTTFNEMMVSGGSFHTLSITEFEDAINNTLDDHKQTQKKSKTTRQKKKKITSKSQPTLNTMPGGAKMAEGRKEYYILHFVIIINALKNIVNDYGDQKDSGYYIFNWIERFSNILGSNIKNLISAIKAIAGVKYNSDAEDEFNGFTKFIDVMPKENNSLDYEIYFYDVLNELQDRYNLLIHNITEEKEIREVIEAEEKTNDLMITGQQAIRGPFEGRYDRRGPHDKDKGGGRKKTKKRRKKTKKRSRKRKKKSRRKRRK